MKARIAPQPAPYPPELQSAFDRVMKGAPLLTLFKTLARNPRVAQRIMASGLSDKGSLSLRQRELMILRTTANCGAEYEWGVHVSAFGDACHWTDAEVQGTALEEATAFASCPDQALIIRLADSLHSTSDVDDSLWRDLKSEFNDEQIIELITLAGFYHTISFLCRTLRIPRERHAARFPE